MGGGPPGFKQGFTCPALLGIPLGLLRISHTGLSPSMDELSRPFCYPSQIPYRGPATPPGKPDGLGCSPFARHYLGNHCCFLFLRVLRCFTSPGVALTALCIQTRDRPVITGTGFPHSEISGSKRVCRSPKLIAAYHVLHRLLMPRHPSCALYSLTKNWSPPFGASSLITHLYAIVKEQSTLNE